MRRLHLIISGQVQGVNFRSAIQYKATVSRLVGWVQNKPDGTVEIVVEGDEKPLLVLRNWCGVGPKGAKVSHLEETWEDITQASYQDFSIR